MSTPAPKPGPHLVPVPTIAAAPSGRDLHGTFRDIAKRHANAADVILSDQGTDVLDPETDDYLAAIAHALTALAYTELAPPRRRPYGGTCSHQDGPK